MLRFVARSMLASVFVVNGLKTAQNPAALEDEFRPLAETVVPLVKQTAPGQVSAVIPNEARTLARLSGVVQVVGAAALAFGIGRRLGAGLLALTLLPRVYASSPLGAKRRDADGRLDRDADADRRRDFIVNLSLLGATLLAAGDTQGKPGLTWRADHARRDLVKGADRQLQRAEKAASKKLDGLDKRARKSAKTAERKAKKVAKQAASELGQ